MLKSMLLKNYIPILMKTSNNDLFPLINILINKINIFYKLLKFI